MVNHEDGGEHDKHGWVKVPSNEVIEVEIWILFTVVNPFPDRAHDRVIVSYRDGDYQKYNMCGEGKIECLYSNSRES